MKLFALPLPPLRRSFGGLAARIAKPAHRPGLAALLLTAGVLLANDASAQFGGMGGGGMGGMGGMGGGRSGRGMGSRNPEPLDNARETRGQPSALRADLWSYEQLDYRLNLLQVDLNLTQAEPIAAWLIFAAKVRDYGADQARDRAKSLQLLSPGSTQPSALEHVRQAVDTTRNALSALEDVEAATAALYLKLSPDQRALADSRIPTIVAPRPSRIADGWSAPPGR